MTNFLALRARFKTIITSCIRIIIMRRRPRKFRLRWTLWRGETSKCVGFSMFWRRLLVIWGLLSSRLGGFWLLCWWRARSSGWECSCIILDSTSYSRSWMRRLHLLLWGGLKCILNMTFGVLCKKWLLSSLDASQILLCSCSSSYVVI